MGESLNYILTVMEGNREIYVTSYEIRDYFIAVSYTSDHLLATRYSLKDAEYIAKHVVRDSQVVYSL